MQTRLSARICGQFRDEHPPHLPAQLVLDQVCFVRYRPDVNNDAVRPDTATPTPMFGKVDRHYANLARGCLSCLGVSETTLAHPMGWG